jgi:DNA ligase-1
VFLRDRIDNEWTIKVQRQGVSSISLLKLTDSCTSILTEKYNGIRALWNGEFFFIKDGRGNPLGFPVLVPPQWFTSQLPSDIYLDGELWCGYNAFDQLQAILYNNRKPAEAAWNQIQYIVFDSPDLTLRDKPYAERLRLLGSRIKAGQQHTKLIVADSCKNHEHLQRFFKDVVERGGEGVVLRHATDPYIPGIYRMWKKEVSTQSSATQQFCTC